METDHHILVLEEEEEVEEEAALQGRQSGRRSNIASSTVISSNGNGNSYVVPSPSSNSDGITTANGIGYESPSKDIEDDNKLHISSVYFDQSDGTESVDGVSQMKNGNFLSSAFIMNSKDVDVHANVEIQKSLVEEMNNQYSENLDDKGLSDSGLKPLEEPHDEQKIKLNSFNNGTGLVDDLIEETDQEVTEFDVERVLEKQNTHDLYCPNCNSCITRRVILRRRKQKIRSLRRKPKHNKVDTVLCSDLDANSTNSVNVQVHDSVNLHPRGSPEGTANDYNGDREPEIFRCLSCFSFFIPTGGGFKLFRLFGGSPEDKNVQSLQSHENENVQSLQMKHATERNWFFSMFAGYKNNMITEPASVNDLGSAHQDARKKVASSSTGDNTYFENASTSIGEKPKNATEQANTDIVDQHKKGHLATRIPGISINAGEPAEDASLGPLQGEVNPKMASSYKSLIPEHSQLEIDRKINIAMPEERPVQNDQASVVLGAPLPSQLHGKGEILNDSAVVHHESRKDAMSSSIQETLVLEKRKIGVGETVFGSAEKNTGSDVIVIVETKELEPATASLGAQNIDDRTEATSLLETGTQTYVREQIGTGLTVDILKSIVYGGLIESITSLGIVSSAAAAGSATLNILALGLANVIGGLFIIGHNLLELKNDTSGGTSDQMYEPKDRYHETLGRRENFLLHATVVIISFLIFGMLPPVIYGFSFHKSDNKDLKLAVVGGASLICIMLLAIGKAHVRRRPKSYISTVLYHVVIGVMASGACYIAGDLIGKLLEKTGWSGSSLSVAMTFPETKPIDRTWASY
ncbi:hypothetical protein JCGZ_00542 [Jatropha curcas]|uniref:Membrane protein of ER body-like protein n=1 Tax=Jatropha curcas TaxID=180498 RepID=A0A067JSZ7_JATCU|nr:membrane protein of ER body-like protein isoform X2 [Jatropha curcas]KDP23115.1 hypothetical protein JCGZ_00542 [Jatropha curcas]